MEEMKKLISLMENENYGMPSEQEEQETVTYSKTKRTGTASVTVSANAKSMEELHSILKLAGITLPADHASKHPPDEEPEVCDQCGSADCDCPEGECDCADEPEDMAYSTNKSALIDAIRAKLQARMA